MSCLSAFWTCSQDRSSRRLDGGPPAGRGRVEGLICAVAPGNTHLPSKYMKTTKATATSAQSSNCESSMEFPQLRENARPVSKVQSINRRVSHVPYHGLRWIIIDSPNI
jgi:hypothetical protein